MTENINIDQFLEDGVLIRVSVYGSTMFKEQIGWEQIGVNPNTVDNARVKRAHHILSPEAHSLVHTWSIRVRNLVQQFSVDTEAVDALMGSHWHWVSAQVLPDFQDAWEELMRRKDDMVMFIIQNLDQYKDEARQYWTTTAQEAWGSIRGRIGDATLQIGSETFEKSERDKFVAYCVAGALAKFPTEDEVRTGISASYYTFEPFSSAQKAREQTSLYEAQKAYSEAQIARMQADDMRYTEQARKDAILQAQRDRARALVATMKDPVVESLEKALLAVSDEVQHISDSYNRNGYLNWTLVEKASKLRQFWTILGGEFSEGDMAARLQDLERFIASCPQKNRSDQDTAQILDKLNSIGTAAQQEAQELAEDIRAAEREARELPANATAIIAGLQQALQMYPDIYTNHRQLRALLNDLLPDEKRANNLLELSVLEHIPQDYLRYKQTSSFPEVMYIRQLATRLVSNYSVATGVAEWVTEAWKQALPTA